MFKNTVIVCFLMGCFSCAHHVQQEEPTPVAVEPAAAPPAKVKIKYVYVQTPETVSGMSIPPMDQAPASTEPLRTKIIKLFWPLLGLLAAGFLLIVGLFIEHLILNKQLARRSEMKAQLHA